MGQMIGWSHDLEEETGYLAAPWLRGADKLQTPSASTTEADMRRGTPCCRLRPSGYEMGLMCWLRATWNCTSRIFHAFHASASWRSSPGCSLELSCDCTFRINGLFLAVTLLR